MNVHYKCTRAELLPAFLKERTLAFPTFDKLNDPFESSIESTITYLREEVRQIQLGPLEKQPYVKMRNMGPSGI